MDISTNKTEESTLGNNLNETNQIFSKNYEGNQQFPKGLLIKGFH